MTTDIKLTQQNNGRYDFTVANGDLEGVEGFDTALQTSLFTDARAPGNKVLKPEDRRGWIGNILNDERELGSLLWLVEQRRLTQDTLNETVDYARKSLQWLTDDGIAKNVEVSGSIIIQSGIQLNIIITAPDGRTNIHYVPLWELTGI
jgi:phage gp46-like protein